MEQQQCSARRLRKILAGLAVVAAVAMATSLVAGMFWRDANVAKRVAQMSEELAKESAESATQSAATALKEAARANEQTRLPPTTT